MTLKLDVLTLLPPIRVQGSSGGVVVKLLASGANGRGSSPGLATAMSEIGYLLLPSRDMDEISLKRCKFSKQPNSKT